MKTIGWPTQPTQDGIKCTMNKPIDKDVFGNQISLAASAQVEQRRANINRLLLLVGEHMGWEGDISHVFVSDQSTLGDFGLEPDGLRQISEKLGFVVSNDDYLTDIAVRMSGLT